MKRRVLILLLTFGILGLVACENEKENEINSSQIEEDSKYQSETESLPDSEAASQEEEQELYTIVYKDIVFGNQYNDFEILDCEPQCNEIGSTYNETSDECLYAFCLNTYNDGQREPIEKQNEIAIKTALENGFMVISDYPYCSFQLNDEEKDSELLLGHCVIAGTMADIKRVFDETPAINDYYWVVSVAPRPDWVDIISQIGWDGETEVWTGSWVYGNYEKQITELIGTESQVMISVPVILPKEETNESK